MLVSTTQGGGLIEFELPLGIPSPALSSSGPHAGLGLGQKVDQGLPNPAGKKGTPPICLG